MKNIVEFVLYDGTRHYIDFSYITMVSKKTWKNIDAKAEEVTTITLISGNEIHISGLKFDLVVQKWLEVKESQMPEVKNGHQPDDPETTS